MLNTNADKLLSILADGQYHLGTTLGKQLSITRSAIWKIIHTQLVPLGIDIECNKQRGYRIPGGLEFLNTDKMLSVMGATQRAQCPPIEIHTTLDSTNTPLLQRIQHQPATAQLCFAEHQTAGRGRRGRQWYSGFARNVLFSCLWHFPQGAQAFNGLSLVVGLIVRQALQRLGAHNLQLKWPNDVMWQQRKLAGIGIESRIDNLGACYAVIGIGINIQLPQFTQVCIEEEYYDTAKWVDLQSVLGNTCSRNTVAGILIDELLIQLPLFQHHGLAHFKQDWLAHDMLYQQPIDVHTLTETVSGIMNGIDDNGGLILQTATGQQCFHMGEVSVRKKCPEQVDDCVTTVD